MRAARAVVAAVLLTAAAGLGGTAATASAATFVVTDQGDADDLECTAPHCTLREAINAANKTTEADEIHFNDDEPITPLTPLPEIVRTTHITSSPTGSCRADSAFLRLDGNGADFPGLVFAPGSDGSRLCAVNVKGFTNGIEFRSDNNAIRLSRIGTDFDGTTADPNSDTGILVTGDSNRIGGTRAGDRNIISGNAVQGILVAEALDTRITGNLIGTDSQAAAPIGNGTGVHVLEEATGTVIGGTDPDTGNVISGNVNEGVLSGSGRVVGNLIGTNGAGSDAIMNGGTGVHAFGPIRIGGPTPAERNVIAGNLVDVSLTAPADVQGNYIGLINDGTKLPGGVRLNGVLLGPGSNGATVGGTDDGMANVIAGHEASVESADASEFTIQGNVIGLEADGATTVPTTTGIRIGADTTKALITGNTVIAENATGLSIAGDETTIENNTIGLDTTGGPEDAFTGFFGIAVEKGASDTTIDANTIANQETGVELREGSTGTVVEDNMIGTDAEGEEARSNEFGIGIGEEGGPGTGRVEARIQGNVISANEEAAVASPLCRGTDIALEDNRIGVAADGSTPLGNGGGVQVGCDIPVVPAPGPDDGYLIAGNTIAHSASDGVSSGTGVDVEHTAGGVIITGNEIFDHSRLGIDAFGEGVTANGFLAPEILPPFPVLTNAEVVSSGTTIQGTIDFAPGRDIRIEFFANPACDASGHGEGRTPLGTLDVTGSGGPAAFSAKVAAVATGQAITATATDLDGRRTSEFSRCEIAGAGTTARPPDPPPASDPPPAADPPPPPTTTGPPPPPGIPGIDPDDDPPPDRCTVPGLIGLSLAKAKKRLTAAKCRTGKVTRPKRRPGRNFKLVVKRTSLKKGAKRPAGTAIKITLKWKKIDADSRKGGRRDRGR